MCSPYCIESAKLNSKPLDRRWFLKSALGTGVAAAVAGCGFGINVGVGNVPRKSSSAKRKVVDLTHTLTPEFPTFSGAQHFKLETLATKEKDGYNVKKWDLIEHTGTHIDAPFHFDSSNVTVDQINPATLYAPLAVIDISERARRNADSSLTVDDIKAWEKAHGSLPEGACVAMNSGWSLRSSSTTAFRNADPKGQMHFPGFHPEVAEFLATERSVVGVASDTISIDIGASTDFKFHTLWLSSGRWGIECLANVGELPPSGAEVFIGAPKVGGGTGGLTRVLALVS